MKKEVHYMGYEIVYRSSIERPVLGHFGDLYPPTGDLYPL